MKNRNGSAWTAADVPDLRGRVVVVTGANSGIGFEGARVLTHARAHTILACWNTVTGEEAGEQLARLEPEGSTEVLPIHLANQGVRAGVRRGIHAPARSAQRAGEQHRRHFHPPRKGSRLHGPSSGN